MADFHNDLKGLQGGQNVVGTGQTEVDDFYHLNEAKYTSVQGMTSGVFNLSLGITSIVVNANIVGTSRVFLQPTTAVGGALVAGTTGVGVYVAAGTGSFTATHGSATSSAIPFNWFAI